jgi:outer membrane immunogenic protein
LPGGAAAANFSTIKTGWVLGGGVETAIGALFGLGRDTRWTAKLEYLYVDLGSVTNAFGTKLVPVCASTCATPATGSTSFLSSSHVREQIIRIGVNYRFDTAVAAISK